MREGETGFVAEQQGVEVLARCSEKVLEMGNKRRRQIAETPVMSFKC